MEFTWIFDLTDSQTYKNERRHNISISLFSKYYLVIYVQKPYIYCVFHIPMTPKFRSRFPYHQVNPVLNYVLYKQTTSLILISNILTGVIASNSSIIIWETSGFFQIFSLEPWAAWQSAVDHSQKVHFHLIKTWI